MKTKMLKSHEMISSGYEMLHDIEALRAYYQLYQKDALHMLPPVPVIHKDRIISYFPDDIRGEFEAFLEDHATAVWVLLDGSHRTTAADLLGKETRVMILEDQDDIDDARMLAEEEALFQYKLASTMEKVIQDVVEHYKHKKVFQTVPEKTKKILADEAVPMYMRKGVREE